MKKIKPIYLVIVFVVAIWYFMKGKLTRKEQLTKNFKRSEFDSKDGAVMTDDVYLNIEELAKNLQVLRDELGVPITINSGYRSPAHNEKVGGVKNSMHVKGKAGDIHASTGSSEYVYGTILDLIKHGKMKEGGVGLYNNFVHYDIRGTKARWDFR